MQAQINIMKQKLAHKKVKHQNEIELLENESYAQLKQFRSENQFLS